MLPRGLFGLEMHASLSAQAQFAQAPARSMEPSGRHENSGDNVEAAAAGLVDECVQTHRPIIDWFTFAEGESVARPPDSVMPRTTASAGLATPTVGRKLVSA